MTSRTWTNDGGIALSAANLNSLEADLDKALGVPDAALAARVVAGATKTALDAAYVNEADNTTALANKVAKGEVAVRVADYGVAADGTTDDTAKILTAMNDAVAKGVPLIFDGTKRYRVEGLTTPAALRIHTYGATFVKVTNNGTYAIKTGDNFHADSLKLEVTGGASNEAGIFVGGSDTVIERIKITSLTADQPGANALFVGDLVPANKRFNIRLNQITITGFRSPMRVCNVDGSRFSNGTITNFMTGVYVVDNTNTTYDKFTVTGTSPNASGANGQNGILMEAQSGDFGCSNVRITNWLVDGAPEHSYRVGGGYTINDVLFEGCVSRNPGNAAGNTSTGGGAFKCLGGVGHWHKNIRYINCSGVDSNTNGSGINNFSQFAFGYVDGLTLTNPTVRALSKTYSAQIALYLNAVKNVQVVNPDFRDTKTFAVFMGKDGTNVDGEGVTNVRINGGFVHSATTHAVSLAPDTTTLKNAYFDNVTLVGNTAVARGLRSESADVAAPVLSAPSAATTGGTLAAATYYYKATYTNSRGETTGSNEISQVTTGTTSKVTFAIGAVPANATGMKIYRSTATGTEVLLDTLVTTPTTYTDDGSKTVGTATVPTVNTSGKGAYTNVVLRLNYELNATPGAEPPLLTPSFGVIMHYQGPLYGYTMTADNGSTMVDTTNGQFKIRKAGSWVAL